MTDLSVQVAGVPFKNPIIPASGVFGYGHEYEELFPLSKLGGIATKGTTITPRPGNPSPRIAETPSGMLNSVGLQNPGIDAFIERELPYLLTKDTVILANIAGSTIEECVTIAERLDQTDVHMIEHLLPEREKGRCCVRRTLRLCGTHYCGCSAGNQKAAGGQALSKCNRHHRNCKGSGSCRSRCRFPHQYPVGHAD